METDLADIVVVWDARTNRRRLRILKELLKALATPLTVARDLRERANALWMNDAFRICTDHLIRELTFATRSAARVLAELGQPEPRLPAPAADRGRMEGPFAPDLIAACRGCALSLCRLAAEARSMADTATAHIALGALRVLEKQLWLLKYHVGQAEVS